MDYRKPTTELVSLYNFLLAQAGHESARINFVLRAAGARCGLSIMWRADNTRRYLEAIEGLDPITRSQLYKAARGANKTWGRAITAHKKAEKAAIEEMAAAAKWGDLAEVVRLSELLRELESSGCTRQCPASKVLVEVIRE